jgi:hypothetical protein
MKLSLSHLSLFIVVWRHGRSLKSKSGSVQDIQQQCEIGKCLAWFGSSNSFESKRVNFLNSSYQSRTDLCLTERKLAERSPKSETKRSVCNIEKVWDQLNSPKIIRQFWSSCNRWRTGRVPQHNSWTEWGVVSHIWMGEDHSDQSFCEDIPLYPSPALLGTFFSMGWVKQGIQIKAVGSTLFWGKRTIMDFNLVQFHFLNDRLLRKKWDSWQYHIPLNRRRSQFLTDHFIREYLRSIHSLTHLECLSSTTNHWPMNQSSSKNILIIVSRTVSTIPLKSSITNVDWSTQIVILDTLTQVWGKFSGLGEDQRGI